MRRYSPLLSCMAASMAAAAIVVAAPVVSAAPAAAAPAAPAPAWGDTFTADAVGGYLGDKKPNVMVVGATAISEPAAESLRGAMRASKRAGLVMDAQAIGATEGLDDRTIVDRAKTQPVGQIVIVRVFDGGPGEAPSAIVTFYKPDGGVATAITATAGTAIASNGAVVASSGVSSEAVDAVESIGKEVKTEAKKQDKVDREAQAKYDAEYLWFENWIGVSAQSGAVVARWSNLKQGKYGTDVRGSALYKIVGRDDLLKRYRTRLGIRLGVGIPVSVGGFAMMTAGLITLFRDATPTGPNFGYDDPIGLGRKQLPGGLGTTGSFILMGVGGGLYIGGMIFAIAFKSHPINRSEAAELVDTHNQGLRKKFGLAEPQARVRIGPAIGPQQTGVTLSGRF
jgi:hypothetical protein